MKEYIMQLLELLIFAGVMAVLAVLLKSNKERILALVTNAVRQAEAAIQGSGMGQEKKQIVITWLETSGVRVTTWLSKQIDKTVKELNERQAWAIEEAGKK